jgi:hypothetical protein
VLTLKRLDKRDLFLNMGWGTGDGGMRRNFISSKEAFGLMPAPHKHTNTQKHKNTKTQKTQKTQKHKHTKTTKTTKNHKKPQKHKHTNTHTIR